jgi:hypothetical protein
MKFDFMHKTKSQATPTNGTGAAAIINWADNVSSSGVCWISCLLSEYGDFSSFFSGSVLH